MKKIILTIVFITTLFSVLSYLNIEKKDRVSDLVQNIKLDHKYQIDAAILPFKNSTNMLFNGVINNRDVLTIHQKGLDAKDKEKRDFYRDELYKKLGTLYHHLKKFGIKQLHFHFPDTTSFLRFHKPSKYGDNLKDIRYSLVVANNELKKISGFEEGRIFNGYRFVYPLFLDKRHIGSVETSLGFNVINDISKVIYQTYQYMILNKDVVKGKLFSGERKNYEKSYISDSFYHEANSFVNYKKKQDSVIKWMNAEKFQDINNIVKKSVTDNELLEYKQIVKFFKFDKEYFYASFLPINNIQGYNIGYIISYKKCSCYADIAKEYNGKTIAAIVILSVLFLFLFFKEHSGKKLQEYSRLLEIKNKETQALNLNLAKNVKEKTAELQKYLDMVNDHIAISTADLNGKITYVNKTFCNISGYDKNEIIGNRHNMFRHPEMEDKVFKELWETIVSGKTWRGRIKNLNKDKTSYWIEVSIEPAFNDEGDIISYSSVGVDVSDKVGLEELTLNQEVLIEAQVAIANLQRDNAMKASDAKSEFLANMSHEIRTPLNAILGFISLIKEDTKGSESEKYVDIVEKSGKNLLSIIEDILDFSKIESGNLYPEIDNFNSREEFENVITLFKARAKEKNITFDILIDENLPEVLRSDSLRIKQVISNLLSNAVKFTPEGESIKIDISYNNERLNVSVKDNGIGIEQNHLKHIFEAFSQADMSTTRKYGGTGLGLSICNKLVELLGGELNVESKLNEGSRFYFWIPVSIGTKSESKIGKSSGIDAEGKHVLVVEDNKSNQVFMKVLLKKMNCTFDIASDGVEAVDMFIDAKNNNAKKYDIILMDENMPNMNGIEASRKILEYERNNNLKHTPIIAVTANAVKGDREKFLSSGMDEYITKPVDKEELLRKISLLV